MSAYRRRNNRTNVDQELAEVEAIRKKAEEEAKQSQGSPAIAVAGQGDEPVKRSKLGWQIRLDLKKTCQRMAVDLEMNDYEVLEMLLDEALSARATKVEK
jgi:hypothetical protein